MVTWILMGYPRGPPPGYKRPRICAYQHEIWPHWNFYQQILKNKKVRACDRRTLQILLYTVSLKDRLGRIPLSGKVSRLSTEVQKYLKSWPCCSKPVQGVWSLLKIFATLRADSDAFPLKEFWGMLWFSALRAEVPLRLMNSGGMLWFAKSSAARGEWR